MTLSEKLEGSTMFKIGNEVIRRNRPEEIGTVLNIVANVHRTSELTIYDVEFPSGREILHGQDLRALYPSCGEWQHLSMLCQEASEIYYGIVLNLADVGTMTHAEVELLRRRTNTAREFCRQVHERLRQHSADHGC